MNQDKLKEAAEHYRRFCECVGVDLTLPDTVDTPLRVAKLFLREFTRGYTEADSAFSFTTFPVDEATPQSLVTVTGIRWDSCCRHHHLPVFGFACVAYLPEQRLAGLSKLPRLVKHLSAKPTVQEDLTKEVALSLAAKTLTRFAAVQLVGTHTCMACRGVHDHDSRTITTYFHDPDHRVDTRQEFLQAVNLWHSANRGI